MFGRERSCFLALLLMVSWCLKVESLSSKGGIAIEATLPDEVEVQTGVLLPNPATPSCAIGISSILVNGSVAIESREQPTAYPVPSLVHAKLSLQLASLLAEHIEGGFSLELLVPKETLLVNVSGAVAAAPIASENNTVSVDLAVATSLPANAAGVVSINMSVSATSQDFLPRVVKVNGKRCAIGLKPNITAAVPLPLQGNTESRIEAQDGHVSISGNRLVGVDGNLLTLRGANWFGFETEVQITSLIDYEDPYTRQLHCPSPTASLQVATMVDGFWGGSETLRGDFATVAYRMQLLGFNAIRLPFSFLNLFQNVPKSYTKPCTISSQAEIRANVINPRDASRIQADAQPPSIVDPPATYGTSGICNDYVPNNSIYTRFLFVVRYLARQGFYIMIDNHANTDPTIANNPETWKAQWLQLMQDIVKDGPSKARVMVDIVNEPDSRNLSWEKMRPLYLGVMDAIHQISPTTLFLIEGTAQHPIQMCWGDGFVTDGAVLAQHGLSDPRPFFDELLQKPYLNNVIISPHYYGPSVSGNTEDFTGPGMAKRASTSWGSLATKGYGGHVFPIVIGETGSGFTQQRDLDFFKDFSLYLNNQGHMNDGNHAVVHDVFWWAWNSNSGDTGGLVDTTWENVIWNKTEYLEQAIGLRPWSLIAAQDPTPSPATPTPTIPTPTSTPPPVPAVQPTPTPGGTGQPCHAKFSMEASWEENGTHRASFNLYVSNSGSAAVTVPYGIVLRMTGCTGLEKAWNWQASFSDDSISGKLSQEWQTLLPSSQNQASVGGIVTYTSGSLKPTSLTVAGVQCSLDS